MTAQAGVNALVAEVLPQGGWGDGDYLWVTDHARRLVEFTDGYLEVLPMPSREHQRIVAFLYSVLHAYLRWTGGEVLFAPLRLRIRAGKFREPDLVLLRDAEDVRSGDRFWSGADLVVEVVSPDDPGRDFVHKRGDYAEAGIPEYWIVDPRHDTITVLALAAGSYVEHGVYSRGDTATSPLLAGLAIDVASTFDARE
jgi:Uma2 family endonuclease